MNKPKKEKIKTSDKIYYINRHISLKCIALKQPLSLKELETLNIELAEIIKEVRILEK